MSPSLPKIDGLYDPQNEHDACGVGFVAHIKGLKSHSIVENGLQILMNLEHRGASGSDPETGDGAGILMQIPHRYFTKVLNFAIPQDGSYGVGMLFLPKDSKAQRACTELTESVISEYGQKLIGWRDVPVDSSKLGKAARASEPVIKQVFIAAAPSISDDDEFERILFLIRKTIEHRSPILTIPEGQGFYINSFSSRTIVYKGLLLARQMGVYYLDLLDPDFESALALVHQRFSTNTFPSWELAHPYRMLAHNGEINTLRGNRNWMRARQATMHSDQLGGDLQNLYPLVTETGSDSATLDNALELLVMGGRSLPQSMMMLMPEAWGQEEKLMDPARREFYEYSATIMEAWDGPAAVAFTDGRVIGACLDRNGLRPARYLVTRDDLVVMASETGVLDIREETIREKWRLRPGRIFMVDLKEGRIIGDAELKDRIVNEHPYGQWLEDERINLSDLPDPVMLSNPETTQLQERQRVFGYTQEDLNLILKPMAVDGQEPTGSMGNDVPLAVLSKRPQLLYNYFKQLFAQVTNPPIDPIREELVMELQYYIGKGGNLFEDGPEHAHQIYIDTPVLSNVQLERLRQVEDGDFRARTISILFDPRDEGSMKDAIERVFAETDQAIADGVSIVVLSDRGVDREHAPIPSLLAIASLHHHLIEQGTRSSVGVVLESGEPREVMHFALLLGYGVSAVNPYLAFDTIGQLVQDGVIEGTIAKACKNFIKAISKGIMKVMSKMGISSIRSYRGAQIFEAIGLHEDFIDAYFSGTPSRISGAGLAEITKETVMRHEFAYPFDEVPGNLGLDTGGQYKWRRAGEYHQYNPDTVSTLQHAVRTGDYGKFKQFSKFVNEHAEQIATLRGLIRFKPSTAIPIDEVEPVSEIVKRFVTGAMSLGSISREAHETLAIAMNRLGGKSNTGEGGEDSSRYKPDADGNLRRSAIKQIASARFGVTANYLVNADELQIKMAQGAKPGEGGQLPGHKVDHYVAKLRHSTPGVTLISPPPHHDIYSIEDLAQLIYDLKNVNPKARISVKLVAEVGVGTVAAGVAKAHADHVLISGHDGGTGASPVSSIKHAGLPWELGLAETQQVLVKNTLRSRIVVQTDGQIKTGREVVIAALLGAEEFGFSTTALISMGCILMRVCHSNTCPAGIATQDPVLRARFAGKPEHVVNFFTFVAMEVREHMAELGFRKFDDMVGHSERLRFEIPEDHWKAQNLNLDVLFNQPDEAKSHPLHCTTKQDHGLEKQLDNELIKLCADAISMREPVRLTMPIRNSNRTVGAMLSGRIAEKYGEKGLPDGTIRVHFDGSAGQSFGAFLVDGVTFELAGDCNDYLGKGLSGGRVVVYPPRLASYKPNENIIAGNTLLYGATSGEVFLRGVVGERFAVRNSGALAVVEGCGDHGCEYMTGGVVVVIGNVGRNFAAGMSGGVAYVMDENGGFRQRVNRGHGSILLEAVTEQDDADLLREMLSKHLRWTGSDEAASILQRWDDMLPRFVKVISKEYKNMLAILESEEIENRHKEVITNG